MSSPKLSSSPRLSTSPGLGRVSRRSVDFLPIRDFLAGETLTHFVDEHHHGLAVLRKDATVGEAMQVLRLNKVLSAPVVDEDGEYVGAVSVGDILRGLFRNLEANLGEHFHEKTDTISAEELDNVGKFFVTKPVSSLMHEADLWMKGDTTTNLLNLLYEGFHINEHKVHHRVYICDPSKPVHHVNQKGATTVVNIAAGTEKEGQSSWHPTDVVSQFDLVSLLWEKRGKLNMQHVRTLEELELTPSVVFTLPATTPAITAFTHMALDHKSCVGIVDEDNKLIGNLSASDLRDLPSEHFAVLLLPVCEFIQIMHGAGPTVEEALAGKRPEGTPKAILSKVPLQTLPPSATFSSMLETLVTNKLHRVYVANAEGVAESIITLTDVLRIICEVPPPPPPAVEEEDEDESEDEAAGMDV